MTTVELEMIERFIDAPWGSVEAMDALSDLISMVDDRRKQWAKRKGVQ